MRRRDMTRPGPAAKDSSDNKQRLSEIISFPPLWVAAMCLLAAVAAADVATADSGGVHHAQNNSTMC